MDKGSEGFKSAAATAVPGHAGFDYLIVGAGFAGIAFAAEFAMFLVCVAGLASALRSGLLSTTSWARSALACGFLGLATASFLRGALIVAERVRKAVHALGLVHADNDAAVVTISIGAAACPEGNRTNATDAIKRADRALYAAKARGRNLVVADTVR